MKHIKVMSVFGTRPEAIKMAPLVKELEKTPWVDSIVCVTAQHREMLDQVLEIFDITPDFDLNIMKQNQKLSEIISNILIGIEEVLEEAKPDLMLVHGDTSTTFAAAMAAFNKGIRVGHVEAGLRSGDKWSPYPEEMNRVLTSRLADIHFAPTALNRKNLLAENVSDELISITGNTAIDALMMMIEKEYVFEDELVNDILASDQKLVLVTAHRRENLGTPMENIFRAIKRLADDHPEITVVYPIHLNPKVRAIANSILNNHKRIHLIEPMVYKPFVNLSAKAHLMLTDSGGIQEEAPALGIPVLVLRTETERPEGVEAGTLLMAGVEEDMIYKLAHELLIDEEAYQKIATAQNPYGDGSASKKIIEAIGNYFSI
ncbi:MULTISPECIES: non-hydrolyzing UDP-N-acetylglucosamine 2-epimerase [unclassified Fusibacter]|uniref:non-hydrolyzing UDP-N-acetylglucosamine 2-epimerase n=1 Tax=unclassified Fusibacter TaxID=2624464 RepID=UPI0010113279|nr:MULTISPECIES: UDP-N-acetylglucosamine 2-epimerase (non-hydrolyzing) [unclassified Fusibacter]MCK8059870.1 UDP-N-acetylglucosamine 2-epimerase (non-hydrolyzing) [Fusibacter sp. A2]NPE21672.1 UDP-N-acetylglucosamine 2-epimerase (non-hydrolyzing) [Fusibacter sp. A1]RXV62076.1 UDP-N-acetylglucosamine 2-epimerase (non-hydrolyzing) [Fusibacter sp. A1]